MCWDRSQQLPSHTPTIHPSQFFGLNSFSVPKTNVASLQRYMCWDFVGMTIQTMINHWKSESVCKSQHIVFNFIITFSTKGVLKWRMFGMYLEIGLHISYISHWNWKETVTYIYWTALFLDHKRPSCMPLTFLIMKISYWIYAANNLGKKCQLNIYFGIWYIMPAQVGVGVLGNII